MKYLLISLFLRSHCSWGFFAGLGSKEMLSFHISAIDGRYGEFVCIFLFFIHEYVCDVVLMGLYEHQGLKNFFIRVGLSV